MHRYAAWVVHDASRLKPCFAIPYGRRSETTVWLIRSRPGEYFASNCMQRKLSGLEHMPEVA